MSKTGPIIIIEDDVDDKDILVNIFNDLEVENEVICFELTEKALAFLKHTTTQPFIIFCDINIPRQSGLEFKREIDLDPQLRKKSIPFIFYTTALNQETINEAYELLTVQGFFQKQSSLADIKRIMKLIVDYWKQCSHPNAMKLDISAVVPSTMLSNMTHTFIKSLHKSKIN